MALNSSNFVDAVVTDQLMTDFRRDNQLLDVLLSSPASQRVLAMALAQGGSAGFAKKLQIPLLPQAALNPTDGYSTVTSFPSSTENPDLSSGYAIPTDLTVPFDINRVAVGTHFLPELQKWTHAAGALLQDGKIQADLQEMRDVIEEAVVDELVTVGARTTASAMGKFPLVTTSEAAVLSDFADIMAELNRQNVPKENRFFAMNPAHEGLAVEWAGVGGSTDYPGMGDRAAGRFTRIAGMNIIYTSSLGTAEAVAFSLDRFALVLPMGIVPEVLRDKDKIGDYTRLYTMFGYGALGKPIASADGNTPGDNPQREGVVSIAVT
jgi:CBS domain-containing protein